MSSFIRMWSHTLAANVIKVLVKGIIWKSTSKFTQHSNAINVENVFKMRKILKHIKLLIQLKSSIIAANVTNTTSKKPISPGTRKVMENMKQKERIQTHLSNSLIVWNLTSLLLNIDSEREVQWLSVPNLSEWVGNGKRERYLGKTCTWDQGVKDTQIPSQWNIFE